MFRFIIPIKYKFLGVLLSILLSSLGVFFFYAQTIFSEDKKLFVMDLNLILLKAATSDIKLELRARLEEIQILVPRVFRNQTGNPYQGLPPSLEKEVLFITFYHRTHKGTIDKVKQYQNLNLLKSLKTNASLHDALSRTQPLSLAGFSLEPKLEIRNRSLRIDGHPLSIVTFVLAGSFLNSDSKDLIISIDLVQDFLRKKLSQSEHAELFLLTKHGTVLSHPNIDATVDYSNKLFPHPLANRLTQNAFPRESLEVDIRGEGYLVSVGETGFNEIYVLSQVRKREAFLALYSLLEKSSLLAGLILAIAVIVSILFASRLTANIQLLQKAARRIGKGDFSLKLGVRSNDELEQVAESFEWMAGQIEQLIDESASKARMEDELETARLVQSTLLAIQQVKHATLDLQNFYRPATECGGDFWDATLKGNILTVIIGDATGHGAPAAILTAVAKSCLNTLQKIYENENLKPEQLLATLNNIVHQCCQGKLLMTMCMVQIDLSTGKVLVGNAGHESPLLLSQTKVNSKDEKADKSTNTQVLFARGERLGYSPDVEFKMVEYQLQAGDTLLLYTDGVSEAKNVKGEEWGERSLKKCFSGKGNRDLKKIKQDIVDAITRHIAGTGAEDDITFLLVKWLGQSVENKKAA